MPAIERIPGRSRKALSIVHIPSPKEEEERAAGRFREQLCKEMRRIGSQGAEPLIAKRNGGEGTMVARDRPGRRSLKRCPVGGEPTGDLERVYREVGKTHQPSGETTAMAVKRASGDFLGRVS